MEVTRANFQEVLEELDSVLKDATFLAIDGEFTGLNSGPEAKPFDTPAQYYTKLRSGSMEFLMVQFGLSVFTHNAQTDKYSQRSYNFYVFPRPFNRAAPDCRFLCQASSIAFLSDHGFDFNKLFNCGIPYLTTMEEERLSKKIEEKQRMREDGLELIPISDEDRPQIEEICTRIEEFQASNAEELTIDRCNAFVRRLIHQEARIRWPNKLRLEAKTEGSSQMMVIYKRGTKEEEIRREAERREKERQEAKNAVGLTALLRKIADSGKIIVGHNMLLDICHMIHQFFGPLPESYREFKSLIHGLFPRLLDTKLICKSPQLEDKVPTTILDALLETIGKKPFSIPDIEPIEGRSYSLSGENYHEAGYDAYVTGLCFIALSNYLGSLQDPMSTTLLPDSPLLDQFLNKLLIIRLKDFPYMNLVGTDPKPSRDHVFHITFPKEWKLSDISQLFSPFGGVYVSWLTETTAYVGLYRREQSASLLKNLAKNKRMRSCKIQTYAQHQTSLNEEHEDRNERKRKSPSDNPTSKSEASRMRGDSANGVDNNREDDGWEMAAGNRVRIVSSGATRQIRPIQSETSYPSPIPSRSGYKNRHHQAVDNAPDTPESNGNVRTRITMAGNSSKVSVSETLKSNSSSRSRMSEHRDEQTMRKRYVGRIEENSGPFDELELRRPTVKLLGSTKRKPEPSKGDVGGPVVGREAVLRPSWTRRNEASYLLIHDNEPRYHSPEENSINVLRIILMVIIFYAFFNYFKRDIASDRKYSNY